MLRAMMTYSPFYMVSGVGGAQRYGCETLKEGMEGVRREAAEVSILGTT